MPSGRRTRSAGRIVVLPLAALLVAASALFPGLAAPLAGLDPPTVLAADDGLDVTGVTRYVIVPEDGVVRATVDLTATNTLPDRVTNGGVTSYFFERFSIGIQPDATRIRASQDGVALRVRVTDDDGYRLLVMTFRSRVDYQETARVRVSYDLAGGPPRSASDVRVGSAFATFYAWAFGDTGTVRVDIPAGFSVETSGGPIDRSAGDSGTTILAAEPDDTEDWYAWINARNDAGLTRIALDLADREQIIVRAWPEDGEWQARVGDLLTNGVPRLGDLIGLPWPVDGPLNVLEIHSPLLEGYAGFYDPRADEITISENLDDLTIVHEASHAWFNGDLFAERWITEGLADTYAARVLEELGLDAPGPDLVRRTDPYAFDLNAWPPPAPIRDEAADAREAYGYDASWQVVSGIVRLVGDDGMRRVFLAAHDRTIAYVGAGPPEPSQVTNDWRRFVDLVEELGGADGVAETVLEWALLPGAGRQLDERAAARDAYRGLLEAGDGWLPGHVIRLPMERWEFARATALMPAAAAVLDRRDETAGLAETLGLTPPGGLREAYEAARAPDQLGRIASEASHRLEALEAIADAAGATERPRDWLVDLGLDGADPDALLAAAESAWESADLEAAATSAAEVVAVLDAAPELGRSKATTIGAGVTGAILVLLVVTTLVGRRRRRLRVLATAAAAPVPAGPNVAASPPFAVGPQPEPTGGSTAGDASPSGYGASPGEAGPTPPEEGPDRYGTLRPDAPGHAHLQPEPRPDTGVDGS